tara:strand:- start:249 stop:611 length:363 start_codon:yes stop_codon:yes gene_type:complete
MMDKLEKFSKAVQNLRPETPMAFGENVDTEEEFNKVKWQTGVDEIGSAIFTTTNPYPELTWVNVKAEMDRLQAEYDSLQYARNRKSEYPSVEELVVALYDDEDKSAIEAKRAEVKAKYPK